MAADAGAWKLDKRMGIVMPLTKSKLRALCLRFVAVAPLLAYLCGCTQADAPKMADAPPPPAPKPEELKVPVTGAEKKEYGARPKYQRAMEKLGKGGRGQ
jgi:hypothetical protein